MKQALWLEMAMAGMCGFSAWAEPAVTCAPDVNYGYFSTDFETPHTPWAKPWHAGPQRIVFWAPGNAQRDGVELAQRMDLDIVPVMTHSPDTFAVPGGEGSGGGDFDFVLAGEVERAAEMALDSQWDALVMGRGNWEKIPLKFRYAILSQIHDRGAGLVIVKHKPRQKLPAELETVFAKKPLASLDYFKYAAPYQDLPYFGGQVPGQFLQAGEFGKGRVLMITYPADGEGSTMHAVSPAATQQYTCQDTKYRPDRPDYDYYMSLVARGVVWATRTDSPVTIREVGVLPEYERAQMPAALTVSLGSTAPASAAVGLRWRIRDAAGMTEKEATLPPPQKPAPFELSLPVLKSGTHHLDLWAQDQSGKVLDWATTLFRVRALADIQAVELQKPLFAPDETVSGAVVVTGAQAVVRAVAVEVWDCLGALKARGVASRAGSQWIFALPVPDARVVLHSLRVRLEDENGGLAEARRDFSIGVGDDLDEFRMVMWGNMCGPIAETAFRRARAMGVDTVLTGVMAHPNDEILEACQNIARLGFLIQPMMMHLSFQWPMDNAKNLGVTRMPTDAQGRPIYEWCFRGPDWQKKYPKLMGGVGPSAYETNRPPPTSTLYEKVGSAVDSIRDLGIMAYNLGDEVTIDRNCSDACFCPACEKSFREYAKDVYGSLEALNASWGTRFKNWDGVTGITLQEAKANGQYVRWAHHRRHMEIGYSQWIGKLVDHFKSADPNAKVGVEGISFINSFTGFDIPYLFGKFKMAGPYDGSAMIRLGVQFTDRNTRRGTFYGTYGACKTEAQRDRFRSINWDILARHMNCPMFYRFGFSEGQGGSAILTPTFDLPVESFGLPMAGAREIKAGPGRLILQSERQEDGLCVVYSQPSVHVCMAAAADFDDMKNALTDLFWTLEDAGLGYRVITDAQLTAETLKAGSIKALILPRVRVLTDAQSQAILEFVRHGGTVMADVDTGIFDEKYNKRSQGSLAELFPEQVPLAQSSLGKGKSVYLGNYLDAYALRRSSVKRMADGRVMYAEPQEGDREASDVRLNAYEIRRLLAEHAGVKPPFAIKDQNGNPYLGARGYGFKDGENAYLIVVSDRHEDLTTNILHVTSASARHVYNVRDRQYLGKTAQAAIALSSGRPAMLAFLPYKMGKVSLTAQAGSSRVINFKLQARASSKMGRNVFHVMLLDRHGREVPELARNLTGVDGQAAGSLQLPLNAPAGIYLLKALDVASGLSCETQIKFQ